MQMAAGYRLKKITLIPPLILITLCVGVSSCSSVRDTMTSQNLMQPAAKVERPKGAITEDRAPVRTPSPQSSLRDPDFQGLGVQVVREDFVRNYLDRIQKRLRLPSKLYAVKIPNSLNRYSRYRPIFLAETRGLLIPSSVISSVRYESELAAMLAWEYERSLVGFYRIEPTYEPEDQIPLQNETLKKTVRRLYDAGFDPRGLVGFLEGYQNRVLSGRWAIRKEKLNEWMKVIRAELAVLPPLLSPIVRSREFVELQAKVAKVSP